jgi:hypothetical protein
VILSKVLHEQSLLRIARLLLLNLGTSTDRLIKDLGVYYPTSCSSIRIDKTLKLPDLLIENVWVRHLSVH